MLSARSTRVNKEEQELNVIDRMVSWFEWGVNVDEGTVLDAATKELSNCLMEQSIELRAVTFRTFCDVLEEKGYPVKASDFLGNI